MSLPLHETSELLRIAELVDLLAAHDKLVKTFLVPIAQAAIDDYEHARAVRTTILSWTTPWHG